MAPTFYQVLGGQNDDPRAPTWQPSLATATQKELNTHQEQPLSPTNNLKGLDSSKQISGNQTAAEIRSPRTKSPVQTKTIKPIRYGDRPV